MAITFVVADADSAINGGSVTLVGITSPTIQVGDLIVAFVSCAASGNTVLSVGYTAGVGRNSMELIQDKFTAEGYSTTGFASIEELGCYYHVVQAGESWSSGEIDTAGSGVGTDSTVLSALVFRGVDPTHPFMDGGFNSTTGVGETDPDPAAITPSVNNAGIVIAAKELSASSPIGAAPANYTNVVDVEGADTNAVTMGVAYRILVGGSGVSEDPGAWTWNTNGDWVAATLALRPLESGNTSNMFAMF